jgi:arginase
VTGRRIAVIGAPSSAGSFAPGQEDAPAALRDAGLLDALRSAGADVADLGDVPGFRWRPDRANRFAMHAPEVGRVALAVSELVTAAMDDDRLPLVLGGDCTVELGSVRGVRARRAAPRLVYLDPHADLNTPGDVPDGALDWMGVAHLTARPGAVPALVALNAPRAFAPEEVVLLGWSRDRATAAERAAVEGEPFSTVTEGAVAEDPVAAAGRALALLGDPRPPFLVHLDVDAVDFNDHPLSENTDRNVGLTLDQVAAELAVLTAAPELAALTVTELNPRHGEPGGATVRAFVERLVAALV